MEKLLEMVRRMSMRSLGVNAPTDMPVSAPQTAAHVQQLVFVLEHYLALYRALTNSSTSSLLLTNV